MTSDPEYRPPKVAEMVARDIVRTIVREGLGPGAKLRSEPEMIAEYRVSRSSLREALRILELYGILTMRPGKGGGPVVQRPTARDMARSNTVYYHVAGATFGELVETRSLFEPMMAERAARSMDDDIKARLEKNVALTRAALDATPARWNELVQEFHELVSDASGNRVLDLYLSSLRSLYFERLSPAVVSRERSSILEEHAEVAAAIVAGDPDKSRERMARHMKMFDDHMSARFEVLFGDVLDWR